MGFQMTLPCVDTHQHTKHAYTHGCSFTNYTLARAAAQRVGARIFCRQESDARVHIAQSHAGTLMHAHTI